MALDSISRQAKEPSGRDELYEGSALAKAVERVKNVTLPLTLKNC